MGHLLKIKCVHSWVNVNILASTSVPFIPMTVQVPNLALNGKWDLKSWNGNERRYLCMHWAKVPSNMFSIHVGDLIKLSLYWAYTSGADSCTEQWAYTIPRNLCVCSAVTIFDLWPLPLGGGAWGAGTNMWHPETPASYEWLPAPLATQIPTLWIHTFGGKGRGGGSDIRSMSSIRPICKCRCPPLMFSVRIRI